ncbi:hypothetical protein B6A10_07505 [Flavobacterium sp. L1I52]|uniref:DUF805 domain-containing protein n=1 Tax=Flavobacterium pokkalii TaxID=1940408 RepID=A0ABR7UQ95_9FLAO|nr:hypothetical protein [Flavobacterium pokkalii]
MIKQNKITKHFKNLLFFYSSFSGKSGRIEFGIYFLIYCVLQIIMIDLYSKINLDNEKILNLFYVDLILLLQFVPMQAVATRRLRDLNLNTTLIIVNVIPIISILFKIYLTVAKSKHSSSKSPDSKKTK